MDSDILIYIQEYIRNDILTPFMVLLTHTGDYGILAIAVTLILILVKRTRCLGHVVCFSIAIESVITNVILKNLIARTRPYEVIEELEILIGAQPDYSFPSGHSGVTFALAGALLYAFIYGVPGFEKNKRNSLIVLFVLLYAVLLTFSRMYVGVHYPTDVLAGMLIGLMSGCAGYYLEKRIRAVWERRISKKAAEV
jgi:undecaprenyl-diphosphatase